MIQNDHDAILSEFGESIGINLSFDEDRFCELYYDNRLSLSIHSEDSDGTLSISCPVLEKTPDDLKYTTILDILDDASFAFVNNGNAPLIGRDGETGFLFLYQICTASYLAQRKFIDIFISFIEYRDNIVNILNGDNNE